MSKPQLLSGVRGVVMLGATPLAFIADVIINVREGVRQTYVMGRMNPGAIDSLSYDVDVSVGRVYPVNNKGAEATTKDGSVTLKENNQSGISVGLETTIATMVSAEDLSIVLQDKQTQKTIANVRHARFAGRSFSMMAGDVAQERYNFVGIFDSGYDQGAAGHTADVGYGDSTYLPKKA